MMDPSTPICWHFHRWRLFDTGPSPGAGCYRQPYLLLFSLCFPASPPAPVVRVQRSGRAGKVVLILGVLSMVMDMSGQAVLASSTPFDRLALRAQEVVKGDALVNARSHR